MSCKRSNGSPPTFNPPNKVVKTEESCIFCHKDCDEKQKEVSVEKWEEFHSLAKQWCGLDKFGDVLTTVDWVSGHRGKYWHKSCQLIFTGSRKLKQAIARKNSEKENVPKEESLTATNNQDERPATRGKTGTIHNPDVCIWCTKSIFGKNSERYCPSRQLVHQRTWSRIGASIAYIEDAALRERLQILVDSTTDWKTESIWYHDKCYKLHMRPLYEDQRGTQCRAELSRKEVNQIFLNNVGVTIFDEGEPRTLRHLLQEYLTIIG